MSKLVNSGQLLCFGFLEAHKPQILSDYSVNRSRGYAALPCNLSLCTVALGLSFLTQCEFLNLFDLCGAAGSARSTTAWTPISTASFINFPN